VFDDSNLYYYRARYYDPELQRFLSLDPIGFSSGDFNFYRYVGNDPVNFLDPYGSAKFCPKKKTKTKTVWKSFKDACGRIVKRKQKIIIDIVLGIACQFADPNIVPEDRPRQKDYTEQVQRKQGQTKEGKK
jgi:RHS repeat-associated protein